MPNASPARRFVIGDVHGCAKALRGLIDAIEPGPDEELIFLGDYIDRGPDSRDVVQQIIDLQSQTRVITLRGNHEVMISAILFSGRCEEMWLKNGGHSTVTSYGGKLSKVPDTHREFFRSLKPHHETGREIFVHASYDPAIDVDKWNDSVRYWNHLAAPYPTPHHSGRRVFVGHTPQLDGKVLDLGHLICVDTYCFGTGSLTALNLEDGSVIQFSKQGMRRRRFVRDHLKRLFDLF